MQQATSVEQLQACFNAQRQAFDAKPYPEQATRLAWLSALHKALINQQDAIAKAISQDFSHRSHYETQLAELMPSVQGIHYAKKQLKHWLKPSKRKVGLAFQPAKAFVYYQPKGVVGIIVPWNYPLFLSVGPLTAALGAGNRVMIKMSEATPHFNQLFKSLLGEIFPENLVAVIEGEADIAAEFSGLAFDHLLFTGSTQVGKKVMQAASENLTPVTLELGGKSPAIISDNVPMDDAASRIGFGKMLNAGQTCVAPDYVLLPQARQQDFIEAISKTVKAFYPNMENSPDYTAIVNAQHFSRLQSLIDDAKAKGANVITLHPETTDRRMPLTLLLGVNDEMLVMQQEIFGPILPIVCYQGLNEALDYVRQRPRPLALYYFDYDDDAQQTLLQQSHAGGVCFNDTLLHVAQEDLPFGGIGPSGMGSYHGHEGFLTFSHAKSVLKKPRFNSAKFIYPPFGKALQKLILKLFIR